MKNVKRVVPFLTLILLFQLTSCDNVEENINEEVEQIEQVSEVEETSEPEVTEPVLTSFNITITNVVNYLNAIVFNTHNAASEPGPIPDPGCFYAINFKAVPGTKLSFATMSVVSNDWFFAPSGSGIPLFMDGKPKTGDVTEYVHLWDLGVEEEDPTTFTSAPGGAEAGEPDDNVKVRKVEENISELIKVYLSHSESTGYFTLKIENIAGKDHPTYPTIITPGIVVLHAQDNPLFTIGEPDRGYGLEKIAVQGNPTDLNSWFTETGESGAPLRLSSSFTVFAPGIVYAFDSESDPVFKQGEQMIAGSGIEEIAEDGNNGVIFDYITNDLMLPAAKSNETMPIGPGGSLTFTLDVPEGHKLGYNTMFVFSNDWFIAHNNTGFNLFNEDGTPVEGYGPTEKSYLYDAGTEVDQVVGFGPDQAPFQAGPNTGAADENNLIRRVMKIDDMQFGKGVINSEAGVVGYGDVRGGYNLVKVKVEPNM